jgi:hypothetical protein
MHLFAHSRGHVLKIPPRRRGRPRGSTVVPPDFLAEVWVAVRLQRIRSRIGAGKTPSVRQACDELAAQGGIISAVGGNVEALAATNAQRKKRLHRFAIDSTGSTLTPNATGNIFASHRIASPATLRARYSEADKLARSDRRVRLAWMNICRQRLGRPAKKVHLRI